MQKIISRFLMLIAVLAFSAFAQAETLTPTKGVIRIKLQDAAAKEVGIAPRVKANGVLTTGVHTLDVAAQKVKASSIRRVFPYAPAHESRMALYGLDRWYEVSFDESINPLEAKLIFGQAAGVQVATCKVPMVLKEGLGQFKTVNTLSTVRPSEMPFNDPRLPNQWHYNNTGSLGGSKAGADINLFEAWKTTTGKKEIVVAIIDGGIDYTHEDLAANVLLNTAEQNGVAGVDDDGNGYVDDVYGWNFCTGTKDVYPHAHGTHVAGTVAAVNNNGKGVAGIAGGDGSANSGVSLLSVQVFDSRSGSGEGDFAASIVYAANRGASIANCSWGWATDGYYEQDVLDAIDYFIGTKTENENDLATTKAQRNLSGGVMFFATGNDGAHGNFYPACYEPVVAVGAMTCDYTIASYSNYGSWVDIVAPGGLLDYGDAGGVLSTLPNDQYGYNEGTSMATPHVTGIAALVASKYGSATMPAETIRQQILTSVNDLYAYNEGKEGLHGAGYIDAAKALQMNTEGTAPEAVASIIALPAQDNITLQWTIPASNDGSVNHHIVYYSTSEITAESDLSTLNSVAVDTKFAASGDLFSYELGGLSPLTTYYIAIKAVDRWGNSSALSPVISATTNAGPKMKVDKSSLSMTLNAANATTASATFNISNLDEGLLKWSASLKTTQSSISTYSLDKVTPGLVKGYSGKIGAEPYAANEVYSTADFKATDYPRNWKYYNETYASIGEADTSLPNSMAQWFHVDASQYPDGFNLTAVKVWSNNGDTPILRIYNGNGISSANLLAEVTPSYFYSDMVMRLTEQIHFAPGESFWVVVHFPTQEKAYPLGLAITDNSTYPSYCYMSNDMGKTWSTLADALKGSPYEVVSNKAVWAITAMSQNPDWSTIMTLTPSEGTVKYNESQAVTIANDGQPLVNGTYKFNLRFKTNESEANTTVIPVTMTVKGNLPVMTPAKVVNFGSLLVGETKTLTVEVYNEGYGPFGYYGSLSGNKISCNSEHFKAPTYINGGFPARSAQKFDVSFTPQAAGSHTGTISFKHSDNTTVFNVTVTGTATDPAKIVIDPDTIACDTLDIAAEAITKEFTIKNEGNYPLEYVLPKFSDQQLESQGKAAHKFGYTVLTNLNGATDFAYDGNPTLIGGTDITSLFNDNTYLSGAIDLGFAFPFYGKEYEQIYISSYGGLALKLGELSYYPPLTESSERLTDVPYISAYGYQLALNANSKIEYAKQDGKFVVNFSNVLALVYDQEYAPISFRIMLSANGDIEIFYDNYDPMSQSLFQDGSTLFCGLKDQAGEDPVVVTSADIADYWGNNDDPAGDIYTQFTHQSSVKFMAPKANFVTNITPAFGIVNPGESVTLTATLQANENMVAGETFNNIVVMSNDPKSGTSYIHFDATITGESLAPMAALNQKDINFGKVFRTSVAQLPVTIKNNGKDSLAVESIALANNAVKFANIAPAMIAPGMSKDVVVTLPTENEGVVADVMTIVTNAGTLTANIAGEVIGCPEIQLSYTAIDTTVASGTPIIKPLTIANNGNESLVYSITPNPAYISFVENDENAKVSYTFASSADDSDVAFDWIDIETTGLGEQNTFSYYNTHDYVAVELPFEFPFYGKKYSKMYIYNTGFVSFTEREDQKIWPEPPAEFPAGTIYTNIIAPYWGLHTMDTSKTAGTYHYMTEDEIVVSWMEYGNSMNMGVCYQLIMKKDGSFKFQYKGFGDYAIIYGIFGLAGISNEGGSEGIRLPERYVVFDKAVQFYPVVESTIAAGQDKVIDIEVLTDKMAGNYNSNIVVNTNVPGSEKIEMPLTLNITGEAQPVFPDTIIIENVMGTAKDEYKGPITQMGAFYEAYFKIENKGTASFTINNIINEGVFSIYDSWYDEYYSQPAQTWFYGPELDWMTGEPTGNYMWSQYYDSTPVEVGKDGLEISIPIMQYTIESTPGTYDVPLKVAYNEADTANILVRFIVTNAPYLMADKPELRIENAESDFVGIDSVTITNAGQYKLTYELRLDPTGKGEEIIVDEGSNPGIAPMMAPVTLSAEVEAALRLNLKESMQAFEVSSDSLNAYDAPLNFDYNRVMYYPSISTSPSYTYGTGDAFGQYISATHYVAPEDGFNISHVYIATTLTCEDGTKVNNVDYTVEIVNGADYENGDVLGKGTFHIDDMDGAKFVVIPLDRAVYMNPGQEFYVRVTYPVGIEWPAYLSVKQESVVNNRYMGYVEGYGWFDIASMFKNQYGSLGYIMSCLETVPGAPWVKMLNPDSEKVGELQPGESLNVKFEFNAAEAPLDKGNKAVLVVKSNDLYNPVLNFPITLDKNAAPVITVPTENILAKEATTTLVEVTINEPENDDFTINIYDSGNMSSIQTVKAMTDTTATIEVDAHNGASIKDVEGDVKVVIGIMPQYESAGEYSITVTATDSAAHESQKVVRYTVAHTNRAPVAQEAMAIEIEEGTSSNVLNVASLFSDPDGDELTYSWMILDEELISVFASGNNIIIYGNTQGSTMLAVTATDPNGATADAIIMVDVTAVSGIENISINAQVGIYPNPVVETLYVTCDFNCQGANFCIYGENGAVVYNETQETIAGVAKAINVANLPDGLYILKVTTDQGVATYPVVKK